MGRSFAAGFAVALLALPDSALADSRAASIDIRVEALSSALQDLARQTGAELLFDRGVVGGIRAAPLRGRFTLEAALLQLLAGTGLTQRRAASGAWIVERRATEISARQDLEVPEILVVGHPTGNADIRRRENDIQPYRVTTQAQLTNAHRDTVDQYFGSRVTQNTQFIAPSLLGAGQTNSAIDLRGLGAEGTLILVDGRRMAGIPLSPPLFASDGPPPLELMQPDVNAIPFHAIERIETLTGTAGGIYGFGALGGVVNIVLKRDYRGAELHATGGLSARGDAARYGFEGRVGFTPDHGDTEVMLSASHWRNQPLLYGQRDFAARNRADSLRLVGDTILSDAFNENGVGVFANNPYSDPPLPRALVLKPQ